MKSTEEHAEMYRATVQAEVADEPVLAVGLVATCGATKSAFIGLGSPLVALITRRRGKRMAPGFPMNALLAVTPTRLIAFGYRPRGFSIKVTERLVEWPLPAIRAQIVPAATERGLDHVVIDVAGGQRYELELLAGIGQHRDLNDAFRRAVSAPVAG